MSSGLGASLLGNEGRLPSGPEICHKSAPPDYKQDNVNIGLPYFEEQKRGHIILPMSTSNHG